METTRRYAPVHRIVFMILAPLLGVEACARQAAVGTVVTISPDSITMIDEIRAVPFALDDELGVLHVTDLIATPTGYAVADAAGQVLLLNDDLTVNRRFGREGAGPRELRLPQDLEAYGDSVAVFDSGNARITVLDREGQLAATLAAEPNLPTDFAVLHNRQIVVTLIRGTTRLAFFHPNGLETFGTLPEQYRADGPGARSLGNGLLVATSDRRVHHYDKTEQLLYTYGPDHSLETVRGFSEGVLEQIADLRSGLERGFAGQRLMGFSLVLRLSEWGPYPVMVAPGLPDMRAVALVFDPVSPVTTPILPGPGLPAESRRWADAVALKGDTLTLVNADGIYQYQVRYPPRFDNTR